VVADGVDVAGPPGLVVADGVEVAGGTDVDVAGRTGVEEAGGTDVDVAGGTDVDVEVAGGDVGGTGVLVGGAGVPEGPGVEVGGKVGAAQDGVRGICATKTLLNTSPVDPAPSSMTEAVKTRATVEVTMASGLKVSVMSMVAPGAMTPMATVSVDPFRVPALRATRAKLVGRLMTSVASAGVAWPLTLVICSVTTTLETSHGAVKLLLICSSGGGVVGPGVTVPVAAASDVMVATAVAASAAANCLTAAGWAGCS
jgi:hypothetical protein